MEIKCQRQGEAQVISIKGRLDINTSTDFESKCKAHVGLDEKVVVMDLAKLQYISSAGLRSIMWLAKQLNEKGIQLRFCCLTSEVMEVFRLAGLRTLFPLHGSLEEALG